MKIHILETGYKDKRMSGDQKRETRGQLKLETGFCTCLELTSAQFN